jgi:hypothetical protein
MLDPAPRAGDGRARDRWDKGWSEGDGDNWCLLMEQLSIAATQGNSGMAPYVDNCPQRS